LNKKSSGENHAIFTAPAWNNRDIYLFELVFMNLSESRNIRCTRISIWLVGKYLFFLLNSYPAQYTSKLNFQNGHCSGCSRNAV